MNEFNDMVDDDRQILHFREFNEGLLTQILRMIVQRPRIHNNASRLRNFSTTTHATNSPQLSGRSIYDHFLAWLRSQNYTPHMPDLKDTPHACLSRPAF
jgi:hypothetical protein